MDPNKPTDKLPKIEKGDKITIELGDPEAAADFLEYVANLIRSKKRVTIWVE